MKSNEAGRFLLAFRPAPTPSFRAKQVDFFLPFGPAPPSFRTKQADFFFRFRSCESVGQRREKSLFLFHQPADELNLSSAISSF
jgi:hypothetical protein